MRPRRVPKMSTSTPERPQRPSRRQDYAEATRLAIIEAARKLFAERGFFATRVEDIATEARVAPTTVYAVAGGKQNLLQVLITMWTTDPIVEATLTHIDMSTDSEAILRELASASRIMRESYSDVIKVMLTTATQDEAIADQERAATSHYRVAVLSIAERLIELGQLRSGMDVGEVSDVLWYFFGYSSYFTLNEDNGWSYERAEGWLADLAVATLLE
jgi:AcrR family transcriptional regulator